MSEVNLRALRKRLGLTQREMGGRICMSASAVAMMERGHRSVTRETAGCLQELARQAGVGPGTPEEEEQWEFFFRALHSGSLEKDKK